MTQLILRAFVVEEMNFRAAHKMGYIRNTHETRKSLEKRQGRFSPRREDSIE